MNRVYSADKICIVLYDLLKTPIEAKIHSIFSGALNIKYENALITVVPKNKPMYPNSIRLSSDIDFTELGLEQGMPVLITQQYLKADTLKIKFRSCKKINLCILSAESLIYPSDLKSRIETIKDVVRDMDNKEGISPIILRSDENPMADNVYTAFLAPRVDELLQSIKDSDIDKISENVSSLAGCGVGLTPSSDDFLCGFMAAVIALALTLPRDMQDTIFFTNHVAQSAVLKTNFISGAFLKSSAKGQLSEDVLALMSGIFSDSDLQQCRNAALNVAKFGATSGTDILCGIYFALKNLN